MQKNPKTRAGVRAAPRGAKSSQNRRRKSASFKKPSRIAKISKTIPREHIDTWLMRHLQVMLGSLGRLHGQPVATLLTAAVIGVVLALPTSLYLLVDNARTLVGEWQSQGEIWLYMQPDIGDLRASQIAADLEARSDVAKARLITHEEAQQLFIEHSNLSSAMELLDSNPLPASIVLTPTELNPVAVNNILWHVRDMPQVDLAKTDHEWVERLQAIINLARLVVWVLILGLCFAVTIIVGNTIRLDIENHRQEIIVTKLVGGTDGFVRRPFLYVGFWYGLFGGLIALILVGIVVSSLQPSVNHLLGLFESQYQLSWLSFGDCLMLIISGVLLGWIGSWIGVAKHLRDIEPT